MQKVNVPIAPKPHTVGSSGQGQIAERTGQGHMTPVVMTSLSSSSQMSSQTQKSEVHAGDKTIEESKGQDQRVHLTNQKNVHKGTLDLLQQRILCQNSNSSTGNKPDQSTRQNDYDKGTVPVQNLQNDYNKGTVPVQNLQNDYNKGTVPVQNLQNDYNKGTVPVQNLENDYNNRAFPVQNLQSSNTSIALSRVQNSTKHDHANLGNVGGDFSVDFSSVPLNDIDFLAMVTSPDLTSLAGDSLISAPQNTSITSSHENYQDAELLQTRRQSDGFSPSSLPQHGSPHHLSVSPNYPNHTSPPQYFQGRSPSSQHSVSPDHRVSPNLQYQQNADMLQHPSQMYGHQLNTQPTDIPFQSHSMPESRNPANEYLLQSVGNQTQSQQMHPGTSQNFLYRNQPLLSETHGSHSNSNSNSPPSLSINTQQAQISYQHLFQPVPGPSNSQIDVSINSLPNDNFLDFTKFKAFADNN